MSATAEAPIEPGLSVEIGRIDKELGKLWEAVGDTKTRASLINLAIYTENAKSVAENTSLISEIATQHACRALLIFANPDAKEPSAKAWINAHCHLAGKGEHQICSEQITFELDGDMVSALPNIVFSHLDSDLPLHLWWQGEFHDPMDPQLWSWVDRLIYDSQQWRDFDAQMRLVQVAHAEASDRMVLCDLNWTRLVHLRLGLAQFFDPPAMQEQLANMRRVEIAFAPHYRSTALLLVGWLAAQLGWILVEAADESTIGFYDCAGETIRISLEEKAGAPVNRCSLFCEEAEFRVVALADGDLLELTMQAHAHARMHQLIPAGQNEPVALMSEELMRGGPHRVYLRALKAVRELL